MASVRERKRAIVDEFRSGSLEAIEAGGAEVIMGEAAFSGPKSVRIALNSGGERELSADWIFLDTGSRPWHPPITGLDSVTALNSTSILELDRPPEHLLVLGGGYIGLEFGQMFRRFGSRVTIVQADAQLLSHEDTTSPTSPKILREDGIDVLLNAKAIGANGDKNKITLQIQIDGKQQTAEGTHLLVAIGRTPNTDPSICPQPESKPTTKVFFASTQSSKPTSPASMALATSRVAPRSPTFPMTIIASCATTFSTANTSTSTDAWFPTPSSSTRSSAASASQRKRRAHKRKFASQKCP